MPPCCASAIASAASVTVSIADEHKGICSRIFRVKCVEVSVWEGRTSERSGIRSTSSKVSRSKISGVIILATNIKGSHKKHKRHKKHKGSFFVFYVLFVAIHVGTSAALRAHRQSELPGLKLQGAQSV